MGGGAAAPRRIRAQRERPAQLQRDSECGERARHESASCLRTHGHRGFLPGGQLPLPAVLDTTASGANTPGAPQLQVARDGRMGDRLIATNYKNFAPRLGIAWSPSEKWSIRAGFGFFYSQESKNSIFDLNRGLGGRTSYNPDNTYSVPQNVTYSNFIDTAALPAKLAIGLTWGANYRLPTTYSMQYVFNVQRTLGKSTNLEVGFNGSESRHLANLLNASQPLPRNSPIVTRMPFPEWGPAGIQFLKAAGVGNYNGVSGRLSQPFVAK